MNSRKHYIALSGLLFLCACAPTVEFVRKDTAPKRQAVVRYSITTDAEKEAKYRADLTKQAREFCAGDYQINREFQAREYADSAVGVGTGVGFGMSSVFVGGSSQNTTMYNYVEFACK